MTAVDCITITPDEFSRMSTQLVRNPKSLVALIAKRMGTNQPAEFIHNPKTGNVTAKIPGVGRYLVLNPTPENELTAPTKPWYGAVHGEGKTEDLAAASLARQMMDANLGASGKISYGRYVDVLINVASGQSRFPETPVNLHKVILPAGSTIECG